MSTNYYVQCRTCHFDDADITINKRIEAAHALIQYAPQIAALADFPFENTFLVYATEGSGVPLHWFKTHVGHDLVVMDEYGHVHPTAKP